VSSLRKQWEETSFQWKFGIVVAIGSGIILPILFFVLPRLGDSRDVQLEVVDVVTAAGTPERHPVIDVTVRNTGEAVSIIKRASFRIREFDRLDDCGLYPGYAGPTGRYEVEFPQTPQDGATVEAKVSQEAPLMMLTASFFASACP
jgi:hypothetical protein